MIKTYEDWENSLDQNYVRQLSPDAWDLTGSAFEAGQQSQQAKIDELQARVDGALKILKDWDDQSYRDDMDQLTGEIEDILKENGDERLTKIRVP